MGTSILLGTSTVTGTLVVLLQWVGVVDNSISDVYYLLLLLLSRCCTHPPPCMSFVFVLFHRILFAI